MKAFKIIVLLCRMILIILTLLLIFLPHLSPERAGSLFFISFLALPLLIINMLMVLFSKKVWRWVFILLCILSLPIYGRYIPSWQKFIDTKKESLSLLSWNADNFLIRKDTMLKATAYINQLKPDIICLQERPHTAKVSWDSIQAQFPDYPYRVTNSREDEVLNVAVLSRWPLSNMQEHYFEETLNKYITVDVNKDGKQVRIFNVHLQTTGLQVKGDNMKAREVVPAMYRDDLGDEKDAYEEKKEQICDILTACVKNTTRRNHQAHEIVKEIKKSPYPILLCGDFNDTPSSYSVRTINSKLHDLSCRWPFTGTFQNMHGLMKIDYIFCSDDVEGLSYQLISNPWSDHKIQIAKVEVENF